MSERDKERSRERQISQGALGMSGKGENKEVLIERERKIWGLMECKRKTKRQNEEREMG